MRRNTWFVVYSYKGSQNSEPKAVNFENVFNSVQILCENQRKHEAAREGSEDRNIIRMMIWE